MLPCTDTLRALQMCPRDLCGRFTGKAFFFELQSTAGKGRSWTLSKQTNQKFSYHPLYQIERHSCVFMWKGRKVNSSSIITAVFGSSLYYNRKFTSHLFTSLLMSSDEQRFLVRGGNTRFPLFHMSRHIYQPLRSYCSPELVIGTESFPEVISGESFQREVLCIIS